MIRRLSTQLNKNQLHKNFFPLFALLPQQSTTNNNYATTTMNPPSIDNIKWKRYVCKTTFSFTMQHLRSHFQHKHDGPCNIMTYLLCCRFEFYH